MWEELRRWCSPRSTKSPKKRKLVLGQSPPAVWISIQLRLRIQRMGVGGVSLCEKSPGDLRTVRGCRQPRVPHKLSAFLHSLDERGPEWRVTIETGVVTGKMLLSSSRMGRKAAHNHEILPRNTTAISHESTGTDSSTTKLTSLSLNNSCRLSREMAPSRCISPKTGQATPTTTNFTHSTAQPRQRHKCENLAPVDYAMLIYMLIYNTLLFGCL